MYMEYVLNFLANNVKYTYYPNKEDKKWKTTYGKEFLAHS